jgi:NAD-dependent SIR2 family protein deacetylase
MDVKKKLTRVYTQNIDDLDQRAGLEVGFEKKHKVVQLHGDLQTVVCTNCSFKGPATKQEQTRRNCPICYENLQKRLAQNKRPIGVGFLRPNIVLYNEHHKQGTEIASLLSIDLKQKQQILIVMGTSLKIIGIKRIIKDFHHEMKQRDGILVFINKTEPSTDLSKLFDYKIIGECDKICGVLLDGINELERKALQNCEKRARIKAQKVLVKEREVAAQGDITKFFKSKKDLGGKVGSDSADVKSKSGDSGKANSAEDGSVKSGDTVATENINSAEAGSVKSGDTIATENIKREDSIVYSGVLGNVKTKSGDSIDLKSVEGRLKEIGTRSRAVSQKGILGLIENVDGVGKSVVNQAGKKGKKGVLKNVENSITV